MRTVVTTDDDGPLCEVTEMPQRWCADCMSHNHRRVPTEQRRQRPTHIEVRYRFHSRYGGTCAACEGDFRAGDRIGVTASDEYVCEGCC